MGRRQNVVKIACILAFSVLGITDQTNYLHLFLIACRCPEMTVYLHAKFLRCIIL